MKIGRERKVARRRRMRLKRKAGIRIVSLTKVATKPNFVNAKKSSARR